MRAVCCGCSAEVSSVQLIELLMKTTATAAFPGGDPFASELERMLWEHGYPTHYDTVAEAQAVVEELRHLPEFAGISFEVVA